MSDEPYKPRIVLDFDGVLHSYTSGWKGAENITDPPTVGAQRFVQRLLDDGWEVVVCSTRAETPEGCAAIQAWWTSNDFPEVKLSITHGKPPALVYLDDRALRFDGPGTWPTQETLMVAAVPWTKP